MENTPVQKIRTILWNEDGLIWGLLKLFLKETPPQNNNKKPKQNPETLNMLWSCNNHKFITNYFEKTKKHYVQASFSDFDGLAKKKNPCSHVPNNQTRDKHIPVWPTQSNPQGISTGPVSQRPWQQQRCLVIWLRDEANTSSKVKWQKSLALWNARVGRTNCEAVRPNHSASGTVIFHGPAEDTCATSRGTKGRVGSRVSVISISSATVYLSEYNEDGFKYSAASIWSLAVCLFLSAALFCPMMKSTENSIHHKSVIMRRWRRMVHGEIKVLPHRSAE